MTIPTSIRRVAAPSRFKFFVAIILACLMLALVPHRYITIEQTAQAVSSTVVISQVYGGGGNAGSTLTNDFIELHNVGNSSVSIAGWSVQYASATGTTWQVTNLSGSIAPGGYYLVQEAQGAGGTTPLPTPDATGTIAMSATAAKVALVNTTTALSGACPTGATIVDFVGYGTTANCFEGTGPTAAPSNTTAVLRNTNGCTETDSNVNDFTAGAPAPRNSATAANICGGGGGPTNPTGVGAANPSTVAPGSNTLLTVTVTPGTNPTSTGLAVTGNLSGIGGSATQQFFDNGTNGDVTAGDNVFSFQATVSGGTTTGVKSLPITITDAEARTGGSSISLTVQTPPVTPRLVKVTDFDADNHADFSFFQPSTGNWNVFNSGDSSSRAQQWGDVNDVLVPADYDGDGAADIAVWRPAEGNWYIINSLTSTVTLTGWGTSTDVPVPADYDGDGRADVAVFRPAEGNWYIRNSSGGVQIINWGTGSDKLVPGDYDGDGRADAAVFRPAEGSWYVKKSTGGATVTSWGLSTDKLVAGDYDGDGKLDLAVFRPSEGNWYIRNSNSNTVTLRNWGTSTDLLVPADYDGDKKTDIAVWRPSEGNFYIVNSSGTPAVTVRQFGSSTDIPIATAYKTFGSSDGGGGTTPPPSSDSHLTMGNPSNATADTNFPLNYLMSKTQYTLSYNRDKGEPNWVSWHLDSSWLGSAPRQNDFRPDPLVPAGWYQVQSTDYSGSGFDRGHMCPSADRTDTVADNSATFLMTNFVPQAPDNNQGPWEQLESYCRTLVGQGNELYIISGGYGTGGTGSNGSANTVANGHVNVPAQTWKVIIVLPAASGDDVARVTTSTRTIAVIMPNTQGIRGNAWQTYRVSVDQVEALTSYDFFSNVPTAIQAQIESVVDNQ